MVYRIRRFIFTINNKLSLNSCNSKCCHSARSQLYPLSKFCNILQHTDNSVPHPHCSYARTRVTRTTFSGVICRRDHNQPISQLISRVLRVFGMGLMALTEPRTLRWRNTRLGSPRQWVSLHTYLLYFVVTYMHHQNDTCFTLFASAAVML